jgi:phytoene dehydrogenase-like protein
MWSSSARDLRLAEHGLKVLERPTQNFLPMPDGRALLAGPARANTVASTRSFSARDAAVTRRHSQLLEAQRRRLVRPLVRNRRTGATHPGRSISNYWRSRMHA